MNYVTYLRWGVIGGLFLIPFIPFLLADGNLLPSLFFPYITGKNFTFRILVGLVLLAYVLLALREPKYRPRSSALMWAAVGFVGWMGLATLFSVDPIKSFWSNFERMEGYLGLLHVFTYFVIAGAVLSAEKLWHRFFNTTIIASTLMGCYALLQVFGALAISTQSGPRVDTTFGNATYLAVYMLFHIFLTLYMLVRARSGSMLQAAYGLALVLQFAGLYFTETRGAIIGVVGGLVVAAIWIAFGARDTQWRGLRRTAIAGLVGIVVLVGAFFALRDTALVQSSNTLQRLASISLSDPTTLSRFVVGEMAVQGFMERPVTGWGQENFSFVFNKYYNPVMYNQEQWFDRAHNQFLDWLVAGGLPAFLLYLSLYALAAWGILRSSALSVPEQAVFFGLLAAYGFSSLTVFDNLTSSILFFTVLAFVHSFTMREVPGRMALTRPLSDHALAVAAPVVGIVVLFGVWAFNAPSMSRAHATVGALQAQTGDARLEGFREALQSPLWPGTPAGYQEAVEQTLQFASSAATANGVSPQLVQNSYTLATESAQELLEQRPGDARLEFFIGGFLAQFGQRDAALQHLERARELSPQKQQILFQLGNTYIQAGENERGIEIFRTAVELEPRYDLAHIYYAGAHYLSDQDAAGDAILTEHFGNTIVDNNDLQRVYAGASMWDRAAAIQQLRIEADPSNTELLLGLAELYFRAGRTVDTIAVLRQISALDPARAGEMQEIIKQIEDGTLKPQ